MASPAEAPPSIPSIAPRGSSLARAAVLVLGLLVAAELACTLAGCASEGFRSLLGTVFALASNLGVALLSFRDAGHARLPPRLRQAWLLIGLAYVCIFAGNVAWGWQTQLLGLTRPAAWSDVPFLLSYPLLLAGVLLTLPVAARTRQDRLKLGLDVAAVVASGAIVAWYFVVYPEAAIDAPDPMAPAVAFLYAVGDLILLLAVTTLWLGRQGMAGHRVLGPLAAGLLLNLATDTLYGWQVRVGTYRTNNFLDPLWLASGFFVAVAAERQYRGPEERATPPAPPAPGPFPASLLPYLALALAYGLLLVVALQRGEQPLSGMVACALVLTSLVVARQVVAVRDNVRLLAESAARRGEARFRALVQHSSDGITILDADSTVRFASPAGARVVGSSAPELVGARLGDLLHPDDREKALGLIREAAHAAAPLAGEWRLRHRNGAWVITENIVTNLLAEPEVAGLVLNTRDVSDRRRLEEQLAWQAFHDPLTDLPNRWVFLDRVAHALARAARSREEVAVLFVDLDNFKVVNDSLGHAEGDRLLVAASERLLASVRGGDTVARLGGDEFGLLIEDAKDDAAVVEVVERVTAALATPFELKGHEVPAGASIGIARSRDGRTPEDLLRNADVAMYVAKARGKGGYQFFAPEMQAAVRGRLEGEADLRRAIAASEFCLHYQPILQLADRRPIGLEALLRWRHPSRGLVRPDLFIPLAEETGLIVPIGRWALHEACRQWRAWSEAFPPPDTPKVNINISSRHFQDPSLLDDVRGALAASGVPAEALVIEITESMLMEKTEATMLKLRELKALGLSLAVDDFGTGYSSLGYLQHFPIDVLKIDKTFVDGVASDAGQPVIARAIVFLAETLKLDTVAEGIEHAEQAVALQALGCYHGQGYLFARPVPPEEIVALLRAGFDRSAL